MFEYLPHESDLFIRGKGNTFNFALYSVLQGLIKQINQDNISSTTIYYVKAEGNDDKDLVFNLLENFNSFIDSEGILPCKTGKLKLDGNNAEFSFTGKKQAFSSPIKAVTFHNFKVEEKKEEWVIEVLFDI